MNVLRTLTPGFQVPQYLLQYYPCDGMVGYREGLIPMKTLPGVLGSWGPGDYPLRIARKNHFFSPHFSVGVGRCNTRNTSDVMYWLARLVFHFFLLLLLLLFFYGVQRLCYSGKLQPRVVLVAMAPRDWGGGRNWGALLLRMGKHLWKKKSKKGKKKKEAARRISIES